MDITNILEEKKSHSIRVVLEKLEGGVIANAEGTRKVYKDVDAALGAVCIEDILQTLTNAEYKVNIDIIHQDDYQEHMDLLELKASIATEKVLTLETARENGIVEKLVYNPCKNTPPVEPDLTAPIKVTPENAYSPSRLKAINWADMHEKMHMEPSFIAKKTGMNVTTLYNALPKARKGTYPFSTVKSRVGFTTLAQMYENTLGIRTSTKEQCELMKSNLLKTIREIELMTSGKSHMKCADISKKLVEMRKELL